MKKSIGTLPILFTIIGVSLLLQILLLLPGIMTGDPAAAFSHPDTPGYVQPALGLLNYGTYSAWPDPRPATLRVPGLSLFLAAVWGIAGRENYPAALLALSLLSVCGTFFVYLTGKELFNCRAGLWAAFLYTFNPTLIGNRPLLLSDGLFGFVVSVQVWAFCVFIKRRDPNYLALAAAACGLGTLVRPINLCWILPAMLLIWLLPRLGMRRKFYFTCAALSITLLLTAPWMYRNYLCGGGFTIDTNTGGMYHQNGAMLLARLNHSNYESEKRKILAEQQLEFADTVKYPDERSREKYRMAKFRALLVKYPHIWLPQHFSPEILLPDFPAILERLGITSPGRGTINVLKKDGIVAATRHYAGDNIHWFVILSPLLLIPALTGAGVLYMLFLYLKNFRRHWVWPAVFLLLCEYYFFLPGAITVPRYQIPALPFLCVLAGGALAIISFCRRRSRPEYQIDR